MEHKSNKTPEETYKTIKDVLSKDNAISKYDANAKCTFDDSKRTCRVAGGQFKAEMKVDGSGAKSQVNITVDLPLLLMPFKGKVQESLTKMLSKHLS
jgi:hypothetical protein